MLDKFDVDWVRTLNPEYKKPIEEWTPEEKLNFIGIICHWKMQVSYEKDETVKSSVFKFVSDMVKDLGQNRIIESEKWKKFQQFHEIEH